MLNAVDRMYLGMCCRLGYMKKRLVGAWQEMKEDEKGGTATVVIEIVMIGMVLVLGFVFRKQIGNLFTQLWKNLVVGQNTKQSDATLGITPESNPFQ